MYPSPEHAGMNFRAPPSVHTVCSTRLVICMTVVVELTCSDCHVPAERGC